MRWARPQGLLFKRMGMVTSSAPSLLGAMSCVGPRAPVPLIQLRCPHSVRVQAMTDQVPFGLRLRQLKGLEVRLHEADAMAAHTVPYAWLEDLKVPALKAYSPQRELPRSVFLSVSCRK